MRTIAITNQKGGVGKTTLTCLLALYLAERRGLRVGVVDVDGQANCSRTLRNHRIDLSAEALFDETPLAITAASPLTLIGASAKLNNLEVGSGSEQRRRVETFTRQVASLAPQFDYCLIDAPPTPGMRTVATLAAADFVVVPIELEEYSRDGVTGMIRMIFGVRAEYNPRLKFAGLLPNRVMKTQPRQRAALADLIASYGDYLLPGHVALSTRSAIPRALEAGQGPWSLPPNVGQEASIEVLRVLDALMQAIEAHQPAEAH